MERCIRNEERVNKEECSQECQFKAALPTIGEPKSHPDSGTQDQASTILHSVAAEALQETSKAISVEHQTQLTLRPLQKGASSDGDVTPSYPDAPEDDGTDDDLLSEEDYQSAETSQLYQKVVQWLGKKKKRPAQSAEHHAKFHYGLRTETLRPETRTHDTKAARKRFADVFRRVVKAGSLDEGCRRLIHQQESGYSSPNASAQQTPTATHRLANNPYFMRRSFELSPQRIVHSGKPRMSLPAEHLKSTIDGRFSAQAVERRRRLSRGKTISQDEGFPSNLAPQTHSSHNDDKQSVIPAHVPSSVLTSRRMSRPGSSSREESTGEESGFEEEEPIEIRVPPLVIEERRDSNSSNPQPRDTTDPLAEWSISYEQLQFRKLLRKGSTMNIYRGRWHGDVMIHTFDGLDDATQRRFWELVNSLSMIRHENIVLFMGACTSPPNLAIVTGVRRGMSLHNHTIVRGAMPYASCVNIARQMAQAMSYLHSRGIIHGRLNSRNVFIEAKIKLSLLDHSMTESMPSAEDTGCLANGSLIYYPSEMIRELVIKPPIVLNEFSPTQQTDVYMYGMLLYELFSETPPFEGQNPHSIIYQIGKGVLPDVENMQCAEAIKDLIRDCWHYASAQRPVFPDILQILQQSMSLQRSHSSSEPERLNRIGISFRKNF